MNRKEAATKGLNKFNTGKSCKNGHLSDRYTQSGTCCECVKNSTYKINSILSEKMELIKELTTQIEIIVKGSSDLAIKIIVDDLVSEDCPTLNPDAVNPFPFKARLIAPGTFRIKVRVPIGKEKYMLEIGSTLFYC